MPQQLLLLLTPPQLTTILLHNLCTCIRSLVGNWLTGSYGNDMSGLKAIAAALPKTQISDLK